MLWVVAAVVTMAVATLHRRKEIEKVSEENEETLGAFINVFGFNRRITFVPIGTKN